MFNIFLVNYIRTLSVYIILCLLKGEKVSTPLDKDGIDSLNL